MMMEHLKLVLFQINQEHKQELMFNSKKHNPKYLLHKLLNNNNNNNNQKLKKQNKFYRELKSKRVQKNKNLLNQIKV